MSDPANPALALEACAREPIHVPGFIMPHGILLAVDENLRIRHEAGDVASALGWEGSTIGHSITEVVVSGNLQHQLRSSAQQAVHVGTIATRGRTLDAFVHRSGSLVVLELEPAPDSRPSGADVLDELLRLSQRIATSTAIGAACFAAAAAVRQVTGYDRVMVYRFLQDESGAVIAEDRHQELTALLNHRYPASDIPRQARALYLRNPIRVIPDVHYLPAAISGGDEPLDLSGSLLRSVSPVHIQYLKNMEVGASASISIIQNGVLWGLVACHHRSAKLIPHEQREMCRHLTLTLQQAISQHEEEGNQREALRLTRRREELLPIIAAADNLREGLTENVDEVRRLIPSDGIALVFDDDQVCSGITPPHSAVQSLGRWLAATSPAKALVTDRLAMQFPAAAEWARQASGLLGIMISRSPAIAILWFRAEEVETINWAGNPHKAVEPGSEQGQLMPRTSFELWAETVRNKSRPWRPSEQDAAERTATGLVQVFEQMTSTEMNRRLRGTILAKEEALAEKDLLMREVHHRVQNNLQLVMSMLQLHQREIEDDAVRAQLQIAHDRILSVAMLHRRLWASENLEDVNLDTFFGELTEALVRTWGASWRNAIELNITPFRLPSRQALLLALVVSELLTNAVKHAYDGSPGWIGLSVGQRGERQLEISVADRGVGSSVVARPGSFGSKLVRRLVQQMDGELEIAPNNPGTRVTLLAPLKPT